MTRRPWRLYAARATFPFPQLLVLPSLEKSNRYAARKHQRLFTAFHPQILLKTPKSRTTACWATAAVTAREYPRPVTAKGCCEEPSFDVVVSRKLRCSA